MSLKNKKQSQKLVVRGGKAVLEKQETALTREQVSHLCKSRKRRRDDIQRQIDTLQVELDRISTNITRDEAVLVAMDEGIDFDPEDEDEG